MTTQIGRISKNHETPGWTLHTGPGTRTLKYYQKFDTPFSKEPQVMVALSNIFANGVNKSVRIDVRAINIDTNSFDVQMKTWDGSEVFGLDVDWIATDDY